MCTCRRLVFRGLKNGCQKDSLCWNHRMQRGPLTAAEVVSLAGSEKIAVCFADWCSKLSWRLPSMNHSWCRFHGYTDWGNARRERWNRGAMCVLKKEQPLGSLRGWHTGWNLWLCVRIEEKGLWKQTICPCLTTLSSRFQIAPEMYVLAAQVQLLSLIYTGAAWLDPEYNIRTQEEKKINLFPFRERKRQHMARTDCWCWGTVSVWVRSFSSGMH